MKGILFKPDMIEAIAEGRKTQTRRLADLKEINKDPSSWNFCGNAIRIIPPVKNDDSLFQHADGHCISVRPRYRIGETIYIKEAWNAMAIFDDLNPSELDMSTPIGFVDTDWDSLTGCGYDKGKPRSPMFLRECHARYFIQITDVKSTRLQDISIEDCKAEGLSSEPYEDWKVAGLLKFWRGRFEELWDKINPRHPFVLNEWVFVYSFKKVEKPE